MSLEAWGDGGDDHECQQCDFAKENGFNDGWETALERVALIIDGGYSEGDQADAKALAMSIRAMKDWEQARRV